MGYAFNVNKHGNSLPHLGLEMANTCFIHSLQCNWPFLSHLFPSSQSPLSLFQSWTGCFTFPSKQFTIPQNMPFLYTYAWVEGARSRPHSSVSVSLQAKAFPFPSVLHQFPPPSEGLCIYSTYENSLGILFITLFCRALIANVFSILNPEFKPFDKLLVTKTRSSKITK